MEPLSYAKSPLLIENIQRIENLRSQLLSLIISREDEWNLRWEERVMHIFYSLSLYDLSIQKSKVGNTLSSTKKPSSETQQVITKFKEVVDIIDRHWYVTQEPVTYYVVADLYRKIWKRKIAIPENELNDALIFIQKSTEHPIVQAIAAHATIYQYETIDEKNRPFSHLILMLFLYKNGWDLRGMVTIEHFFFMERAYYKELLSNAIGERNLTPWLEYMSNAYVTEMQATIEKISLRERDATLTQTSTLSERQKDILGMLSDPNSSVTNRQVQKQFKVSAITASRDLTKLVNLGLIQLKGKGRATSYSKI